MKAGALRNLLILKRDVGTTQGVDGHITPDEQVVATVWAEILTGSGREVFRAQQMQADTTHVITIRYRSDVDETWWGVEKNGAQETFQFLAVFDPDRKRKQLTILAKVKKAR
jgi:SPP1 family predicted phage head-tail adaptor